MADDASAPDTAANQEEKKQNTDKEKKPKKSSAKKDKKDPSKSETVSQDSLDMKKEETVEPKYVEAAAGPDTEHELDVRTEPENIVEPEAQLEPEAPLEPEALPEPETCSEPSEQKVIEEPQARPTRKPSRRNYELEIDEEKLNQLKEAFQIFDFDNDGKIDKDDLRKIQIAMGEDVGSINEEELDRMMSEACQPLDFDAFVMLLGYKTIELDPEEVLRDALSRWDNDGTGLISEDRLRNDLMHHGDKFTEKEVNLALEDAPLRYGFGFYKDIRMIDYVKFCHILCGLRKKIRDPSLEEYGLDVSA